MSLELRPQQVRSLDGLRDGFATGNRAQILYGPTGFGKTEIACAMMAAASAKGTRSAMVLDRIVLCDQTSRRLDKYAVPHGVMQAGHWRYRPEERIQVCSAQTLEARGSFPGLQLLIVDECHNSRVFINEFIRSNPQIKVVGLSATPFTKGLGLIYNSVISATTTEELVGAGFLVPLRVFVCKSIDMVGAKKVAGEWSNKEATERGVKISGDVVSEWIAKTAQIFGGPRKTIVFCAGVAHGADLAEKFADAGHNFVSISYEDNDEFKRQAIEEFSKPDSTIMGLIATDILTKGFDVPDVMVGISARPFTKSLSSHIQQLGRVMRPSPGKEFALWLDHSGNYIRFLDDWETIYSDGPGALDDGREKAKKEPDDKQIKDAKCPACGVVWPPKTDVCPACGHVRQRRNDVVVVAGEMLELAKREKASRDEKQRFYSELMWVARERGYKTGWVSHKYQAKFGVWPRLMDENAVSPSSATLKWLQSQAIRWAKSQRAA